VLLSTAKLALQDAIEHSDLPDDPALGSDLALTFPDEMQRDFADAIADHQLRREIIATILANDLINRGGPAFVTTPAPTRTGFGTAVRR
jgi:glutamate dehydrogenase